MVPPFANYFPSLWQQNQLGIPIVHYPEPEISVDPELAAWPDWLPPEVERELQARRAARGPHYDVELRRQILIYHSALTVDRLDEILALDGY
jgi:hypothetical protein